MFDPNQYQTSEENKTQFDSYDGSLYNISDNSFINSVWQLFIGVGRWYAWKYVFYYAVIPLIVASAVYMGTDKGLRVEKTADEISTKSAGNNWHGALGIFVKNVVKKSTKLNEHPYYHTEKAEAQEKEFFENYGYEIKLGKLFKYYVHDGQDYLVMKWAAKGADKKKLIMELSTMVSDDAEDYCENNFDAIIWDDELRAVFKNKLMIRNEKNELTQDNDSDASHFRCIILPDTIEDEIE